MTKSEIRISAPHGIHVLDELSITHHALVRLIELFNQLCDPVEGAPLLSQAGEIKYQNVGIVSKTPDCKLAGVRINNENLEKDNRADFIAPLR